MIYDTNEYVMIKTHDTTALELKLFYASKCLGCCKYGSISTPTPSPSPEPLPPDESEPTPNPPPFTPSSPINIISKPFMLLGSDVDISNSGNFAVAGAEMDGDDGQGSAYVLYNDNGSWKLGFKLITNSTRAIKYGRSVSISNDGEIIIIGAPLDNKKAMRSGAVYVYIRNTSSWDLQTILTSSDGAEDDSFGESIAISGDGNTIIVGSPQKDSNRGGVYIFTRNNNTWSEKIKLTADDLQSSHFFGGSVSISSNGNVIVVGSPFSKSAYVFIKSAATWVKHTKLTSDAPTTETRYGYMTAISGDGNTIAIGETNANATNTSENDNVYIYVRNGTSWSKQTVLNNGNKPNDSFGWSLSLSNNGNSLLIGAQNGTDMEGIVYHYVRNGSAWSKKTTIVASDMSSSDNFSNSVAISSNGDKAIIGAFTKGSNNGGIYLEQLSNNKWTETNKY